MSNSEDEAADLAETIAVIKSLDARWRGTFALGSGTLRGAIEADIAGEVLRSAGLDVRDVRPNSPRPDCVAMIGNQLWGAEVTELVDKAALKRAQKALKSAQKAMKSAAKPRFKAGFDAAYDRDKFRVALQTRISKKDADCVKGWEGGPFESRVLIIVTSELYLYPAAVEGFLEGASFIADNLDAVFLGLDYCPDPETGEGRYPVYALTLQKSGPRV